MFNIHQSIYDRNGDVDEKRVGAYIGGLMEEFAESPEAQPSLDRNENLQYAAMMMEYAIDHLGSTPPKMTRRDFEEVVFEIFPRKVSTEPENGPQIVAELKAFWTFLQRQYALTNAAQILARLNDAAGEELRRTLANPANWGMAKSIVMQGMQAGFDMTTQEGSQAFMLEYNRHLLESRQPNPRSHFEELQSGGGRPINPPPNPRLFIEELKQVDYQLGPSETPAKARDDKRKERKRQRQARKRNREK